MARALVLLAACAAALACAAPARAVESTARIARALDRSPLYVDPSYDQDVLTPGDRRAILAAIRAQDVPVYVTVVALRDGDRFDGEESDFLSALQARVGDTAAVYVAFSETIPIARTSDESLDERLDQAEDVTRQRSSYDTPIREQLVDLIRTFGADDLAAQYARAVAQRNAEQAASATPTSTPTIAPADEDAETDDEDGGGVPVWIVVLAAIVVVAILVGVLAGGGPRRRRTGAPTPTAAPLLPDRVFENARRARTEELGDRTRTEIVALADAIDASATPSGGAALVAYERAVDAAAAASKLHEEATRIVELAGALVLVDHARNALAEAADLDAGRRHSPARPPCFFDPLHGRSTRDVRWAVREVAACATCAKAVRRGREPDALREDGTPWFERDGAIAETGMNRFAPLAPRIARGDAP